MFNDTISLLCPTRGRPDNMGRLVKSALETASDKEKFQVVFYIDEDDIASQDALRAMQGYYGFRVCGIVGKRILLSEMWNVCYQFALGPIYMHAGDDLNFLTQGWDFKVREAFSQYPDRIVLVFGNDGNGTRGANPDFPTHSFLHKNWIDTVGYFCPNKFSSDYNDVWLDFLATYINRKHKIDILTDHLHYAYGKGPLDQTHKDRLERHHKDNPAKIYEDSLDERLADVAKLRKATLPKQNH